MTELDLSGIANTQQVEKTAVTTGYERKPHLLISLPGNMHICQHMHIPYPGTRSANLLLKCYSRVPITKSPLCYRLK